MSLSDFTEQAGSGDQYQSTDEAYEGSYSWKMEIGSTKKILTLDKSGIDQPYEAKIVSKIKRTGGNDPNGETSDIGLLFQWQDNNNFLYVDTKPTSNEVNLRTFSGGSRNVNVYTLDTVAGSWYTLSAEIYEDSGGSLQCHVKSDKDNDAAWEDTVTGTFPSAIGNGAVGLGGSGTSSGPDMYFDESEFYY